VLDKDAPEDVLMEEIMFFNVLVPLKLLAPLVLSLRP
jgi:hypothetical protein